MVAQRNGGFRGLVSFHQAASSDADVDAQPVRSAVPAPRTPLLDFLMSDGDIEYARGAALHADADECVDWCAAGLIVSPGSRHHAPLPLAGCW